MAVQLPRRGGAIVGINVTPLVDVMLVLLVIFMATANRMRPPAIDVDLPHASQAKAADATPIALVLKRDGTLSLNGEPSTRAAIGQHCRSRSVADPAVRATIAADGGTYHRDVIGLVDLIKRHGVEHFAIHVEVDGS